MNNRRKAKKAYLRGDYYFYRKHNYIKAIESYTQALIPGTREYLREDIHYDIAASKNNLGDFLEALKWINKALEIS